MNYKTAYKDVEYEAYQSAYYYGSKNALTVWDALENHEREELEEVLYLARTEIDTSLDIEGIDLEGAYAMEIRNFAL